MTIPQEIWLQWDPDGDAEMYDYPSEGVTWCGEQIHDTDVRYIRADAQPAAPEPDWTQAPPWAQWWAVSPSGYAGWWEDEPDWTDGYGCWAAETPSVPAPIVDLPIGVDWRTTLRRRPEVTP